MKEDLRRVVAKSLNNLVANPRNSSYTISMIKRIVISSAVTLGVLSAGFFILGIFRPAHSQNEFVVPKQPAVEVLNRFPTVVTNQCPRTTIIPGTYDSDNLQEHDHCPSCNMGIFFRRSDESLSCSYCEIIKKI